ncbi:zinc metallochaperone AztD [Terracoccus luteus]|uniref:Pyrroloquinoline-quinone binding quinoprotein n=1 Tax=Terracoccus luteus TaxID=53356 RepID=A0A839PTQ6_9MICO|nr:zinc metallochaperone AztD [Terracoccus luteus]MBB2986549.1 hypothetical protein [Terracoccus luteus]MCP2171862.1 hypothetical protein [Terracoccus luteus]
MHRLIPTRRAGAATAALAVAGTLAACGAPAGGTAASPASGPTAAASTASTASPRVTTEAAGPASRLVVSHDGGVTVVDAVTLKPVGAFEADGFLRLSPAGDGRHVLVTDSAGWRVLDTGAFTEAHGDHGHSYTTEPQLTDLRFAADHPGHVVTHAGQTVLFADGTGEISVFDPERLGGSTPPSVTRHRTPEAHHGVALLQPDGGLVHTVGDDESRSGVVLLDPSGREVARTDECPGVHGEAAAAGDVVTLGCEDGIVVLRDGAFRKVDSPDPYGRIGNQAGSETSPVVLGDYKTDRDADLERPTRVTLTDTVAGTLRVVDVEASYSFRSLERGPEGEALVLGTDGRLRVIDPETGAITHRIPVVAAWSEPTQWQQPRPTVRVVGDLAYVTEPATRRVVVVDLTADAVVRTGTLPVVPNEVVGVTG